MARNVLLTIGLVSVPVKVDTATESNEAPQPKTVCDHQHAPTAIRSKYVCPSCGNDDRASFKKGFPTDDGKYVVVTADEVKAEVVIPDAVKNTMSLAAHPRESVTEATVMTGKVYNLLPGKGVSADQYALFVEATRKAAEDGVALCTTWAYRTKPAMYLIEARQGHLVAHELAWPSEVKEVAAPGGTADPAMLAQFETLIGMSKSDFDADAYKDMRAESIEKLIAQGTAVEAGDEPTGPTVKQASTNVADQLAAALAAVGDTDENEKPAKKKKAAPKKKAS